jgi:hypothetical protein
LGITTWGFVTPRFTPSRMRAAASSVHWTNSFERARKSS